ncbi:cellulase family glycosylhydrolase [Corallococcus sp. ZKHCc1 1396]|uniref:mannan endo-1,4-beta-mannosidase n=1 Tax=Corallococcus soli TaxID=2710757 RepID=A0ABR9PJJ0_9BACT|nr:DUF5060 domain-containing protein [Corallococcus soli]MBE4748093.1 cellulase family glycosylhydrolase [Corallococcus soli]
MSPRRDGWRVSLLVVVALLGCASSRPLPSAGPVLQEVERFARFESDFDVPGLTRAPDDVAVHARFVAPSGREVVVGGFPVEGGGFRVRFTPQEVGEYGYRIHADGGQGAREVASGRFVSRPSTRRGFVRRSTVSAHHLAWEDGTPFLPLGENRFNVYDPTWNHGQQSAPDYIAGMAARGMNTLRIFIFTDCEREEPAPGPQPGCLEPRPGVFDAQVAARYDAIFAAAEQHGLQVVLTLFAVGFTPGETWKSWEDNPYSTARGGPAAMPDDFFDRPELAERRLRYVLARYGASPSLLAVDLLNEPEWDGNVGEATWRPWAERLATTWHAEDPYGHLVTVGSVGLHWNVDGDERPWYASPRNDLLQWHLYGEDFYQVHALAAELTRKVAETWGYDKPILCGEFGYGGEDRATFDHTHVGIWVTTFSGAGGLAHSAPPFTEDSDVPMTPERGRHFRVLADFLARLPPGPPLLPLAAPGASPGGTRAWALGRPGLQALWVMGAKEGYGQPVSDARVLVRLEPGRYRVTWWDDVTGAVLGREERTMSGPETSLGVPAFTRHAAGMLEAMR